MESSPSVPVPGSSFVILSVSIVGILSIALLLLAYYLFLTRCGLLFFWRADQAIAVSVSVVQEQEPPRRSGGGLEEAAIRRIPTFRYGGERRRLLLPPPALASSGKAAATATECAVCLADFRDGERLRLLPPCLHAFHIDCIDAWLQATATCPLCRAAVVVDSHRQQQQLVGVLPRATDGDDIAIDIWHADGAHQQEPAAAPASPSFLPVRRSLSMDSSTDKRFYLALQRLLHHSSGSAAAATTATQGDAAAGSKVGTADGSSSRRLRRTFFSFSQSRGESRSAVLPLPL
jgi:hypothetical protein